MTTDKNGGVKLTKAEAKEYLDRRKKAKAAADRKAKSSVPKGAGYPQGKIDAMVGKLKPGDFVHFITTGSKVRVGIALSRSVKELKAGNSYEVDVFMNPKYASEVEGNELNEKFLSHCLHIVRGHEIVKVEPGKISWPNPVKFTPPKPTFTEKALKGNTGTKGKRGAKAKATTTPKSGRKAPKSTPKKQTAKKKAPAKGKRTTKKS